MVLRVVLLAIVGTVLAERPVSAQGPPAPPAPAASESRPAVVQEASPAPPTEVVGATTPPPAAADGAPNPYYRRTGKKFEYVGPHQVLELAPTPMLDDEAKQRLDPDGKPMFNPAVKQQRDKRGNPAFDEKGKPMMQTVSELGYDEKGKRLHQKKEKPPKMTPVSISRGTLTVDGMTGKAALNYDIADLKYIYLFAPGIGIAVVSNQPFPGGSLQKKAFNEKTLTVALGEHTLQLASDNRLLGKKTPEPAYVMLDREFSLPSKFPVMGYGQTLKAPYAWPGAKPNIKLAGTVAPPPPSNLLPVQLLKPCPAGQMRMATAKALPGQTAPEQPCVPVTKASTTVTASAATVSAAKPSVTAEAVKP